MSLTQCKIDNFGVMDVATIPSDYFDPQRLNDVQVQDVAEDTANASGLNSIALGDYANVTGANSCAVGSAVNTPAGAIVGSNLSEGGATGARYIVGASNTIFPTTYGIAVGFFSSLSPSMAQGLIIGTFNNAIGFSTSGINTLIGYQNESGISELTWFSLGRNVLIGAHNKTSSVRNVVIGEYNSIVTNGTQRASLIGSGNVIGSISSASHAVIGNDNVVVRNENTQVIGNEIVLSATSGGDRCIVGNNLDTSVNSLENRTLVLGIDNEHMISVSGGDSARSVATMRPLFKVTKTTYSDLTDFALPTLVNDELIVKTSHVSPVVMTLPAPSTFTSIYTPAFYSGDSGGINNSVFAFTVVNQGSANLTVSHSSVVGADLVIAANSAARFRIAFGTTSYTVYRLT